MHVTRSGAPSGCWIRPHAAAAACFRLAASTSPCAVAAAPPLRAAGHPIPTVTTLDAHSHVATRPAPRSWRAVSSAARCTTTKASLRSAWLRSGCLFGHASLNHAMI